MDTTQVLIIGAGRIGRVLADLIADGSSEATVALWDKNPQLVLGQMPLTSSVPSATVIFICTPSWTMRDVLTEIVPLLSKKTLIITLAKGCEVATGKTMPEVVQELLPKQPYAILGGPMLAEVLHHGHRGIGILGTTNKTAAGIVTKLFAETQLAIQPTTDVTGVALSSCLKNVYSFLVGLAIGSGMSTDEQRVFFKKAQQEFVACGLALGVQPATINGPAGLGDFQETATSPSSHNHRCGYDSGQQRAIVCSCEGTTSIPSIIRRLKQPKDFPLLSFLQNTLDHRQTVADIHQVAAVK